DQMVLLGRDKTLEITGVQKYGILVAGKQISKIIISRDRCIYVNASAEGTVVFGVKPYLLHITRLQMLPHVVEIFDLFNDVRGFCFIKLCMIVDDSFHDALDVTVLYTEEFEELFLVCAFTSSLLDHSKGQAWWDVDSKAFGEVDWVRCSWS